MSAPQTSNAIAAVSAVTFIAAGVAVVAPIHPALRAVGFIVGMVSVAVCSVASEDARRQEAEAFTESCWNEAGRR